jgi:hypothetical protein
MEIVFQICLLQVKSVMENALNKLSYGLIEKDPLSYWGSLISPQALGNLLLQIMVSVEGALH